MNDKELADKIVALLLDFHDWGDNPGQASERYGAKNWHLPKIAHDFVRDWRVAGACFEALDRTVHDMISLIQSAELIEARERSWPRAIIEACVLDSHAQKEPI